MLLLVSHDFIETFIKRILFFTVMEDDQVLNKLREKKSNFQKALNSKDLSIGELEDFFQE